MIRAAYSNLEWLEHRIKNGEDPVKVMQSGKQWLTDCLFSTNISNFKESEFKPFEKE